MKTTVTFPNRPPIIMYYAVDESETYPVAHAFSDETERETWCDEKPYDRHEAGPNHPLVKRALEIYARTLQASPEVTA